jgi:hypothetical protein
MDVKYICTSCGGDKTIVSAAHPSLDARYAVGWCDLCGQENKAGVRPERQLARADCWNADEISRRKKRKVDLRVLRKVYLPQPSRKSKSGAIIPAPSPTEDEQARARELVMAWFEEAEKK